jgi:hypothetical protein
VLWLVVAAFVAVVCLGLFLAEWVEIPLGSRFGEEALKNRYLAAHRFLERLEVDVETVDGLSLLDDMPDVDSTLVIASSRRTLSARRQQALETWLDDGGHLLVMPGGMFDDDEGTSGDLLLDRLGILFYPAESLEEEASAATIEAPAQVEDATSRVLGDEFYCGEEEALAALSFEDSGETYLTAFPTRGFLYYEEGEDLGYAYNQAGTQMLRVAVGDGMVTVVTALSPWDNRRIHCHDHAHTLRLLMAERPHVFWLFNTEMPPLTSFVWQRFAAMITILGLALVSWLWRSGYRVGPVRRHGAHQRRALMEHVEGVAQFLWQSDDHAPLVAAMRGQVQHALAAHAHAESLDETARVEFLAERCGLAEGVVHWSLEAEVPRSRASFKQMMIILQQLRRSL